MVIEGILSIEFKPVGAFFNPCLSIFRKGTSWYPCPW